MKALLFSLLFFFGCAHVRVGHYVQRTSNVYDLMVVGTPLESGEVFYLSAYKICKDFHKSGFEVVSKNWDKSKEIEGTIRCSGKVDSFLDNTFSEEAKETAPVSSNAIFRNGNQFKFSMPHLKNEGLKQL